MCEAVKALSACLSSFSNKGRAALACRPSAVRLTGISLALARASSPLYCQGNRQTLRFGRQFA
jgi:hypothetical protein